MRKGGSNPLQDRSRNNPWEDSKKKIKVKRTERNKEINKESGKEKRENTAKIGVCINRLYFPSLFSKPTLWSPPKVIASSQLGLFSKMHNFDSRSLWQGCSSWSSCSFLVYFFHRKIPHLMWVANTFDFRSLELIFVILVVLLWHLLLYMLYLLLCRGIFTYCTSYSVVAHFLSHLLC